MKSYNFYLLITVFSISFQLYSQEPIQLDEVLIEKVANKPKLKKIKYIDRGHTYLDHVLYFNFDPVLYLTDSLPEGYIQQIKLYFSGVGSHIGDGVKSFKLSKTEFELTIYEVNDDYSIGKKVNTEPILLAFEEIEKASAFTTKKVELDLTKYNFKASQFFIYLKKITDTSCDECYYYGPQLYTTGDKNRYIFFEEKKRFSKKQKDLDGKRLQIEVKTLTSYY